MVAHEFSRRSDRLLMGLLVWTCLTTVMLWLPVVRGAFDGPSYRWSNFGLSGRGLGGDYWFPLLASLGALATQYLAWRGPRVLFYVLFAGWHGFLAFNAISIAITEPESLRFRGDTLGIDVSLAVVGPALFTGSTLLVLLWIIRDLRRRTARPLRAWSTRNTRWVVALAALLPLQLVLLRSGEPHGTTDQIGVLLTILQWLLVSVALRLPSQDRSADSDRGSD